MMTKHKITSMKGLLREKQRLALQIEQEKAEILRETNKFKAAFWPLGIVNRFRKTADSISENPLVTLGAQLAYAILNATRKTKEEDTGHKVMDFLRQVAENFLNMYVKKDEAEEK